MRIIHKKKLASRDDKIVDLVVTVLNILILVIVAGPLIYVLSASISDPRLVASGEIYLWPKGLTLEGYSKILEYKPIWLGYRNTLFYATAGTAINLVVTLLAAYALSRKDLPGRNIFTIFFTVTMFFSGGLIPTYMVVRQLGLVNTVWSMLLLNAVSMWNVIIARTYFQSSIPDELKEAAFIDGCSNRKLFVSIILPLSKPIIAVLALFYAVGHWNAFFNALIYLSDMNLYPLQLFLRNILVMDQMLDLMGGGDSEMIEQILRRLELKESMKFGIIVLSSLPVLILYPFLQKYFVKGVMIGAIKG
jgi:putative aldouronate transport system permease protein